MSEERVTREALREALTDVLRVFDAPFATSPTTRANIRRRAEAALAALPADEAGASGEAALDETRVTDDEAANQWQGMLGQGMSLQFGAEVAVRMWNRLIIAESRAEPAGTPDPLRAAAEAVADHHNGEPGHDMNDACWRTLYAVLAAADPPEPGS